MVDLTDVAGTGTVSFLMTGGGTIAGEIHGAVYVPPSISPSKPPFASRIDEMPINEQPTHPDLVRRGWTQWPRRQLAEITGVTIHHTMSHSPLALAQYCTGPKGLPSIQYHFWISAGDGCPVWQLVPLEWSIWHDHTGASPTTLSVGLAGRLHEHAPPEEQLYAAARLCRWLMQEYGLAVENVLGHVDRAAAAGVTTVCPGWDVASWRSSFYEALNAEEAG